MAAFCRAVLCVILASCAADTACGEETCLEGQLCVLPASECIVSTTGAECADPDRACTDDLGRPGCSTPYFEGACIDAPESCGAGPDCACLRPVFDDDARLTGQRCLSVSEASYVLTSR